MLEDGVSKLRILCKYLVESINTSNSCWQIAELLSLVRQIMEPQSRNDCCIRPWDIMLSTIFIRCIARSAISYSWERILFRIMTNDLSLCGKWKEEGIVSKIYTTAFPLLIECAVNDDTLGIKRIEAQYDIGCSIINFIDEIGWTLLHHAVYYSSIRVIRFLLENNFSVNEASTISGGITPLHVAAAQHSYEVIRLLLDYGALRDIRSSRGETALDLLLSSALISSRKFVTPESSKGVFQSIYFLIVTVNDLWDSTATSASFSSPSLSSSNMSAHQNKCSILNRVCETCDLSVIEEVVTLATQAPSDVWNIGCVVHSILVLVRKRNISAASMLMFKFRHFLSNGMAFDCNHELYIHLLGEIVYGGSTQLLAVACEVLIMSTSVGKNLLRPRQICAYINSSILQGNLLMCNYIVENLLGDEDCIYSWYDLDIGDDGNSIHFISDFGKFLSSMSPMMVGVVRNDVAVTNLLLTSG